MTMEQGIKRELSIGEVVSKSFDVYRRDFVKYFVLFAVVEVIIGVVTTLAQHAFVIPTLGSHPTSQEFFDWFPKFIGAVVPLVASIFVVTVVFFPIAQGTAIKLASEQIEKGHADAGTSVRFAASRLIWIWALSIVVGIIVVLGFIALVIPGIILTIMFSLAFPVLIVENKGVLNSMGRSRELVSHRWLKTFATFLVLAIIFAMSFGHRRCYSRALWRRKASGQRHTFGILPTFVPDTSDRLLLLQPRQNHTASRRPDTNCDTGWNRVLPQLRHTTVISRRFLPQVRRQVPLS